MDFAFSDDQLEIAGLAKRILEDRVTVARLREIEAEADKGGARFDRDLWKLLADANLLGVALPESVGGSGYGILEQCLVLEQVGRTVAPVPVHAAIVLGAAPIAEFGSDEQRARWAVPTVDGSVIVTAALTEPLQRRPDAPATMATADGDGWRLDGVKTCVPAGTVADGVLVPATTEGGDVAVFIVETRSDGVAIEPQHLTDGDVEAHITLTGAAGERLGGGEIVAWLHERSTIGLCALQLGVVSKALEMTAAYTKERIQFDRPIATFQAVGQRAADAYIDVEAVRLVLWQAAWRLAEGGASAADVDVAAFWAAEAGHRVAHTAVHLHGGTGIDLDYPLHRYFVAAKHIEMQLGGATDRLLSLGETFAM